MSKPENPPASFPQHPVFDATEHVEFGGMTLRDYFAAKAMQGDLAALQIDSRRFSLLMALAEAEHCTISKAIAIEAYVQADAMLEERAK